MAERRDDGVESRTSARDGERFLLSLARALHESGAPSHRIEEAMAILTPGLGLEGRFFSTPTSIFVSFGPEEDSRTTLLRVEPAGVELERMVVVDETIEAVRTGRLGPADALEALEAAARMPPRYGPALTVGAFGLAAATVARFLGGGLHEILAATFVGAQTGVFALLAARRREAARVLEWLASFAASVGALAWAYVFPPLVPVVAAVAGLIVLLPGLTLTVALTELATRHLVSGTARLAGAGLTFLAIGFGLALGARLEPLLGARSVASPAVPLPGWTEALALVLSPIALTVLFRARPGDVFVIGAAGVLAFTTQRAASGVAGPEIGMLVAAFVTGLAGNAYARFARRPAAVAIVPSLLVLVPGSLGVRSVAALVAREVVPGVEALFTLLVLATALAAGILLANFAMPPRRSL